jgi:RNA recognition motif-containing protein
MRSRVKMNIYVGNVKYEMTGEQLQEMFSAYGEVSSARIISDRETGRSKGFGFVEMPNDSEAKAAIDATNEKEIGGRTLKVNEARPREERPRRSPRDYN